jgi:hypothetical protein
MGTVILTNDPASDFTVDKLAAFGPVVMDWNAIMGDLTLTFEADLTAEQQQQVIYIVQHTENERTITTAAHDALASNQTWITNVHPQIISGADAIIGAAGSSAQEKNLANGVKSLADRTKILAQQNNALIRLVLQQFDGTD